MNQIMPYYNQSRDPRVNKFNQSMPAFNTSPFNALPAANSFDYNNYPQLNNSTAPSPGSGMTGLPSPPGSGMTGLGCNEVVPGYTTREPVCGMRKYTQKDVNDFEVVRRIYEEEIRLTRKET